VLSMLSPVAAAQLGGASLPGTTMSAKFSASALLMMPVCMCFVCVSSGIVHLFVVVDVLKRRVLTTVMLLLVQAAELAS
jgi:hypothetical protein